MAQAHILSDDRVITDRMPTTKIKPAVAGRSWVIGDASFSFNEYGSIDVARKSSYSIAERWSLAKAAALVGVLSDMLSRAGVPIPEPEVRFWRADHAMSEAEKKLADVNKVIADLNKAREELELTIAHDAAKAKA